MSRRAVSNQIEHVKQMSFNSFEFDYTVNVTADIVPNRLFSDLFIGPALVMWKCEQSSLWLIDSVHALTANVVIHVCVAVIEVVESFIVFEE